MRPSHIFIVGLPRTGTKLARELVERSPVDPCRISAETFFFGRFLRGGVRDEIRRLGDMRDDANVERFLDLVYTGKLRGSYWEAIQGLTKSKLKLTGSVELRRASAVDTLDGVTPDPAP